MSGRRDERGGRAGVSDAARLDFRPIDRRVRVPQPRARPCVIPGEKRARGIRADYAGGGNHERGPDCLWEFVRRSPIAPLKLGRASMAPLNRATRYPLLKYLPVD